MSPQGKPSRRRLHRIQFHKKNWKWRFYYFVGFELAEDDEDKKQHIWIDFILYLRKTFREALRKKYLAESSVAAKKLSKDFNVTWDQDEISRERKLFELLKNAKSREDQRKQILDFINESLLEIEKSGLVGLIEEFSKEYKP